MVSQSNPSVNVSNTADHDIRLRGRTVLGQVSGTQIRNDEFGSGDDKVEGGGPGLHRSTLRMEI